MKKKKKKKGGKKKGGLNSRDSRGSRPITVCLKFLWGHRNRIGGSIKVATWKPCLFLLTFTFFCVLCFKSSQNESKTGFLGALCSTIFGLLPSYPTLCCSKSLASISEDRYPPSLSVDLRKTSLILTFRNSGQVWISTCSNPKRERALLCFCKRTRWSSSADRCPFFPLSLFLPKTTYIRLLSTSSRLNKTTPNQSRNESTLSPSSRVVAQNSDFQTQAKPSVWRSVPRLRLKNSKPIFEAHKKTHSISAAHSEGNWFLTQLVLSPRLSRLITRVLGLNFYLLLKSRWMHKWKTRWYESRVVRNIYSC